jgi:hypothetical protein
MGVHVRYLAGTIRHEIIDETDTATWGRQWHYRAQDAATRGNTLVVFEIPNNQVLPVTESIEVVLQHGKEVERLAGIREEMQFSDSDLLQAFLRTMA